MTVENKIKKDYLLSYQEEVTNVQMIEEEINELRFDKTHPKLSIDGMPHGNEKGDLSSYAAQLDLITTDLIHARYKKIMTYSNIINNIKRLKNQNEQKVLRYHYIQLMSLEDIGKKMNLSRSYINKIHGNALEHFKIKEKEL